MIRESLFRHPHARRNEGARKQVEVRSHQLEMDAVANAPAQHKHIWTYMYG